MINKYIDHTCLKPQATKDDIIKLCEEARAHKFASVCINSCYVSLAYELLKDTDISVCTVIGFPLGACSTMAKALETKIAYDDGCDEFDMVINIGALKDKNYDYVKNDIKKVVSEAKGKCVKVIIETGLLSDEEKIMAVKLSCEAGASFVKTCTGFSDGVATVSDIKLMKNNVENGVKIKASAGIRDYETAMALIDAGADRIGTSSGISIMNGEETK